MLSGTLCCEALELGVTMMGEEAEGAGAGAVEGAMAAYVLAGWGWSSEAGAWGAGTGVWATAVVMAAGRVGEGFGGRVEMRRSGGEAGTVEGPLHYVSKDRVS